MKTLLLLVLLSYYIPMNAQTSGYFTDARNGQTYKTVTYGLTTLDGKQKKITWMAENLNYAVKDSYCRNGLLKNCNKYGRLYTWPAAIKSCPKGWRLPSNADWTLLANKYGGIGKAGKHLKSKSSLWIRNGQGTNKSLFNAMPYGVSNGTFFAKFGMNAIFWSSNELNEEYAWDWNFVTGWNKISVSEGHKLITCNSVRCVKDY